MIKNQKHIINVAFPLMGIVIVIGVIVAKGEFYNIAIALKAIRPFFLLFAFLLICTYWLFEAIILHRLLGHAKEKLSFWKSLRITLVGQFFNGITPFASGGQPAQLYMLHRQNVPLGTGASVLTKKFIIYQAVLVMYSLLVLVFESKFFLGKIPNFIYLGAIGFTVNAFVVCSLLMIAFNYKFTRNLVIGFSELIKSRFKTERVDLVTEKVLGQIDLYHVKMGETHNGLMTWLVVGLLSIIQLTVFFSIPLVIGYGFHMTHLSFVYMIGAAAFVSMVTAFIPVPGAAIGAEGSFYLIYQIFFPSQIIITALLLWRLYTYYLPLVVGGTILMFGDGKQV
jgi:hypothetical protein